jgi:hypothetical protein
MMHCNAGGTVRSLVVAVALAAGGFLTTAPVPADASEAPDRLAAGGLQAQAITFGPYATMRRANEVANYARSLGYSALAFHNGDGYYVRVW